MEIQTARTCLAELPGQKWVTLAHGLSITKLRNKLTNLIFQSTVFTSMFFCNYLVGCLRDLKRKITKDKCVSLAWTICETDPPKLECKTTNLEISILRKYKKHSRLLFHLWTITLGSLSLVPTSWRLRKTKRRKTSIISLSTWEIEYQQFKLIRFTIPQKPPWCCIQFSPGSRADHLAIRFIDASVWHMN